MPPWVIAILVSAGVTIGLAVVAYLVPGLLAGGRVQEKLTDLSRDLDETKRDVSEIRKEMLRPADVKSSILEMQIKFIEEMHKEFRAQRTGHDAEARHD